MLAARDITVSIGGGTIRLRPTLRAAMRLERQFGGFAELLRLLSEGSYRATTAILAEHADPVPAVSVADTFRLAPTLAEHVTQLVDLGEPKGKGKGSGEPIAWAALFAQFFAIGTGVLGWTPADTWASSPAEILAAYEARREMHSGTGDRDADAPSKPNFKADPDRRAKLKALRG